MEIHQTKYPLYTISPAHDPSATQPQTIMKHDKPIKWFIIKCHFFTLATILVAALNKSMRAAI